MPSVRSIGTESSSGCLFGLEWTISMCVHCTVYFLFRALSAPLHVFGTIDCGLIVSYNLMFSLCRFFSSQCLSSTLFELEITLQICPVILVVVRM